MRPKSRSPVAIIDIGSNSVRLVVYSGADRAPTPIFNEKVLAGLGADLEASGRLSEASCERALTALRRFKLLLAHMGVDDVRVVATAAIRDASNGAEFVRVVKANGLTCEVLSPDQEAKLAGEGVLSGIPRASGIVGDLGGGSLELIPVSERASSAGVSLPLGVLRVRATAAGEKQVRKGLRASLRETDLGTAARNGCFYMVGGSWRALARIDMLATGYPLPITHQYALTPSRAAELRRIVSSPDPRWARLIAPARLATSPVAAMLLEQLVDELQPRQLIVSSFGIREGLLFSALNERTRRLDPLIEAARDAGAAERRFGEHGDMLDTWIAPLFDDRRAMQRLRLASCLLADVAWQAAPHFRADRGVEMALHGNWVGVTAAERVIMAQALSSSFGRDKLPNGSVTQLCSTADLERAQQWGLAIRLGQRLCGGVGAALAGTALELGRRSVRLTLSARQRALVGEPVERRLGRLAEALGRKADVVIAG